MEGLLLGDCIYIPRADSFKVFLPHPSIRACLTEMQYLQMLDGEHNVVELLNVCFDAGNLTLVLPYFEHERFRETYTAMTTCEVACYIENLLEALVHVHHKGIIHRDVKPANFLFSRQSKKGMLIDFGLAQLEAALPPRDNGKLTRGSRSNATVMAERAGTRGFRAPEVLLCYAHQTCVVDMWAVGVILLSFLTHRYPFFSSPDDLTGLAEISVLTGTGERMQKALDYCERTVVWPDPIAVSPGGLVAEVRTKIARNSVPEFPQDAYELLDRLLEPNPATRITAEQALAFFTKGCADGAAQWGGGAA